LNMESSMRARGSSIRTLAGLAFVASHLACGAKSGLIVQPPLTTPDVSNADAAMALVDAALPDRAEDPGQPVFDPIVQIALGGSGYQASDYRFCVLRRSGAVWCWRQSDRPGIT